MLPQVYKEEPNRRSRAAASDLRDCFLYSSRPHRNLHSFPTRRSSDLLKRKDRSLAQPAGIIRQEMPKAAIFFRSEEHTSELQSRRDLVCRLLLEHINLTTASSCMSARESKRYGCCRGMNNGRLGLCRT